MPAACRSRGCCRGTRLALGRDALLQGSAAALFIFDPARAVMPDVDAVALLYGLTKAEAQLASALAQGATVSEYGGAHQVTANTVRTHLKRALAKTGTHRRSQLVGLVANLAAARGR